MMRKRMRNKRKIVGYCLRTQKNGMCICVSMFLYFLHDEGAGIDLSWIFEKLIIDRFILHYQATCYTKVCKSLLE